MPDYRILIAGVFVLFAIAEALAGRFLNPQETKGKDVILELTAGITIPVVIAPTILYLVPLLIESYVPGKSQMLSHWSWYWMFLVLLLADDLTQYFWHRLSHTWPWLYSFHRAHHSARYMSVRIVYRNSLLYYAFMPGLWFSAALIYLGFGPVYFWYVIAKLTIIMGAHSSMPWDAPLYRHRMTRPVIRFLSYIVSTPMTHSAHHGRHKDEPHTHYKGNFGNFLFLWDILFKTAKINQERPAAYGLEKVSAANWFQELIWPLGMDSSEYQQKPPYDSNIGEQEPLGY